MLRAVRGLERDARLFAGARVVAVAGAGVSSVALPVLVLDQTGSAALTASVTGLQVLPYLLLGLPVGALADRWPRRGIMLSAQGAAAIALLAVPVSGLGGEPPLAVVLLCAVAVSAAFVWFDAAAFGALPAIVGRERVVEANSVIWTWSTLVGIGGPAIGGLLVATIGPAWTLAVDALSYGVAGLMLLTIRRRFGPTMRVRSRLVGDIGEGVRFVRHDPVVRALTVAGVFNSVAGGAVTALVVVVGVQRLGLRPDAAEVGLLLAAVAVGGCVGAVGLPLVMRTLPLGAVTLAGLSLGMLAVLGLAAAPSWPVASFALAAWSLGHTVVILNGIATRQRRTPDDLQARVNTLARMVAWGGAPVGAFGAGVLAEVADARLALAVAALVLVAGVRHARRAGLANPEFGVA